jgi:hypothetical protein
MSNKQQDRQAAPQKTQESTENHQLHALIGRQVMQSLGEPSHLQSMQVRRLWEDHYRVNVFVGVDVASARIAHSYFLVADSDGNISSSTPTIMRQY